MKMTISATLLSLTLGMSANALADGQAVEIEITNLTNGTYFTPLLIAAHDPRFHLFQPGSPASNELQAMAEGGDLSGLIDEVAAAGGDYVENPAGGLLAPGSSTTATLEIGRRNRNLSVAAMLLPTNDGFVGLDALRIPAVPGTYTYYLNGYDAGTEANDERITGGGAPGVPGIPAAPGNDAGTGGTGAAAFDTNSTVHVHRSVVGDTDPDGGISDLDSTIHRWQNPVAEVTITVHHRRRR